MRRAQATDSDAVLAFATRTWDGWDYIPHAWPVWLDAPDGVMLVGCVGRPTDGSRPFDADGDPLDTGQPVAIARVARLSPTESWLEGIRVDARVRGLGVGTDLQTAELHVLAGWNVDVIRYATGARNEGSHRLGGRHGFELVASFRTVAWRDPAKAGEDGSAEPNGFEANVRLEATRRRRQILEGARTAGLVLTAEAPHDAWRRVSLSPTFAAGARLYELRSWALQELTEEGWAGHVAAGEALSVEQDNGWAVAILPAEALPAEDVSIHLGLVVGEAPARARLVTELQMLAGEPIRFRLPADDPQASADEAASLEKAGFEARPFELHILGRPMGTTANLPAVDPQRLELVLE